MSHIEPGSLLQTINSRNIQATFYVPVFLNMSSPKRTKITTEYFYVPKDILTLILQPFQHNAESFFVSLVCKQWHSIIKQSRTRYEDVVAHYTSLGALSSLIEIRNVIKYKNLINKKLMISFDVFFFVKSLFATNKIPILDWALSEIIKLPDYNSHEIWETAAKGFTQGGHLTYLEKMHKCSPFDVTDIIGDAAQGGHVDILEWMRDKIKDDSSLDIASVYAAKKGQLRVLQWLHKNKYEIEMQACYEAIRNGHLTVLKWLGTILELKDFSLCNNAAKSGNLEILKWLVEQKIRMTVFIFRDAAKSGNIEMLNWLKAYPIPIFDSKCCYIAAKYGNLDALIWFRENGLVWDETVSAGAALSGNLKLLVYLRENGCPWDKRTCRGAARCGHLEVLKWARENGCEWDTSVAISALKHFEVFKWLVENGCPYSKEDCLNMAHIYGSYFVNVIEYLKLK